MQVSEILNLVALVVVPVVAVLVGQYLQTNRRKGTTVKEFLRK